MCSKAWIAIPVNLSSRLNTTEKQSSSGSRYMSFAIIQTMLLKHTIHGCPSFCRPAKLMTSLYASPRIPQLYARILAF